MPNYSKGKIYTIRCKKDETMIYVGSTIQSLAVRLGGHKSRSLTNKNVLLYKTIDNHWEEWYIELYENYPCQSKEELRHKEGEIIRKIGNLNMRIEGRGNKEWKMDNVEKNQETNKQYRLNNLEKERERGKQYLIDNFEKERERKRKYRMENKEKIREANKQYRITNMDKLKEKSKLYYLKKKERLMEGNKPVAPTKSIE